MKELIDYLISKDDEETLAFRRKLFWAYMGLLPHARFPIWLHYNVTADADYRVLRRLFEILGCELQVWNVKDDEFQPFDVACTTPSKIFRILVSQE